MSSWSTLEPTQQRKLTDVRRQKLWREVLWLEEHVLASPAQAFRLIELRYRIKAGEINDGDDNPFA